MPGLSDPAGAFRYGDQFVGFGQRSRQRLFDKNIDTSVHQGARGRKMMNRRGLQPMQPGFAVCPDELLNGTKRLGGEFSVDCISTAKVAVNHADEPHRFAIFGELMVHARMIATERACARRRLLGLNLYQQNYLLMIAAGKRQQ